MAGCNGVMGWSACGMMMMMIVGAAAQIAPAPAVDCTSVVLTLSDCLMYVTGNDSTPPPAACCTELASVVNNNPQCLCLLFNTTFTGPLGVNVTRAQQLPAVCRVQTPPTSLCTALGVPVPGPVSPVLPPSPAAKTPSPTPAPSPIVPSPVTSSPSSSTAPLASSPSSMSTTPPIESVAPAGSTTSVPPPTPPNSAPPASTCWNAAVATSLLVVASVFFS